jgi:hypothetical protein
MGLIPLAFRRIDRACLAILDALETRITPILFPLARVSKPKPPPTNAGADRVAFVIRVRRSQ